MIKRYIYCWTYTKSYQRKIDGRKSYRNLWDHFLRLDNVDNMTSEAERLFVATHYSGERNWFKFEHYVQIKKYKHHIIEGLT